MAQVSNETRIAIERRIVRALVRHMSAAGWEVAAVYDGGDTTYPRNEQQAMDAVFAVDEASLRFIAANKLRAFHKARGAHEVGERAHQREANDWGRDADTIHGVLLVLGNCEDIVSDWNYTEGDADGFNAAMDAFDAYKVAGIG